MMNTAQMNMEFSSKADGDETQVKPARHPGRALHNTVLFRLHDSFSKELDEIKEQVRYFFSNAGYGISSKLCDHVGTGAGKMLRPLMCLTAARLWNDADPVPRSVISYCACLETIHIISLIHDDIVDDADIRRNRKTVNRSYSSDMAQTFSVYLLTRFQHRMNAVFPAHLRNTFIHTILDMCEGQMMQLSLRGNPQISLLQYFEIIRKKSGVLFALAMTAGSETGLTDFSLRPALHETGLQFGLIYQMLDDVYDFFNIDNDLKKTGLQDLFTKDLTLPIILRMEPLNLEGRAHLLKRLLAFSSDRESISGLISTVFTPAVRKRICGIFQDAFTHLHGSMNRFKGLPGCDRLETLLEYLGQKWSTLSGKESES